MSTVLTLIANAATTAVFTSLYHAIKGINDSYPEVDARLGHAGLGLAWATTAFSLVAFIFWGLKLCFGQKNKVSAVKPEKSHAP